MWYMWGWLDSCAKVNSRPCGAWLAKKWGVMKKIHNVLITLSIILIALLFFFLAFGNRGLVDMYNLKKEVARLQQKNHELEKENDRLRRNMYRLKEDLAYLESVARKELGMVSPGELIYDFNENDEKNEK